MLPFLHLLVTFFIMSRQDFNPIYDTLWEGKKFHFFCLVFEKIGINRLSRWVDFYM